MERASSADRPEDGFTLVELLVVVLVIGVLVAIAAAGLVGAQGNAKKKAATSNLRAALSSAKTLHAEHETYLVVDAATTVTALAKQEPGLFWQVTPSSSPEQITVAADDDTAALANRSKDGYCYYVVDDVSVAGGTTYGRSNVAAATCASAIDTTAAGITWADSPKLAGW